MGDNENIDLWNALARIDPKHVKPIVGKSYKGDSPKPQAIFQKVTEVLGPVGSGWSYTIKERWTQDFPDSDGVIDRIDCYSLVKLWCDSTGGSWEYIGQGKLMYYTSSGKRQINDDGWKISVTDALTKGLSVLGAAAEIHMGEFDRRHEPDDERETQKRKPRTPQQEQSQRNRDVAANATLTDTDKAELRIALASKCEAEGIDRALAPNIFDSAARKLGYDDRTQVPHAKAAEFMQYIVNWKPPAPADDFDAPGESEAGGPDEEELVTQRMLFDSASKLFPGLGGGTGEGSLHEQIHVVLKRKKIDHVWQVKRGRQMNNVLAELKTIAEAS